jgi:hypothetical protein
MRCARVSRRNARNRQGLPRPGPVRTAPWPPRLRQIAPPAALPPRNRLRIRPRARRRGLMRCLMKMIFRQSPRPGLPPRHREQPPRPLPGQRPRQQRHPRARPRPRQRPRLRHRAPALHLEVARQRHRQVMQQKPRVARQPQRRPQSSLPPNILQTSLGQPAPNPKSTPFAAKN